MALDRGRVASTRLLDRQRLLSALEEGVATRVTIISAPAGSGKTSLLRTWIARAQNMRSIVLVSARSDEGEQDFWLNLLAELRVEAPPAAPVFSGTAMIDRVLADLANRRDPIVLIIDDAHELGKDALAHVGELISALPAHAHAVLASRHDLRLGTHQLRLAGEVAEIRAKDLAFTESETRELLAIASIDISDKAVETLQQRTEGWAAGVRLAALSLAVDPNPERFVAQFSGSNRVIADYLLAEMLERQPPHVQRLLLTTSILDRVNGELADLLSGADGSDRILLALEDANAFVVSLDGERTWFRYHPMFRELLRLELRRTTPAQIPKLHHLAAEWFAEHGQVIDAIQHTQAAGDWERAAQLLADHFFDLVMSGRGHTIHALLEAFPNRIRDSHPELSLANAAVATVQGRYADAAPLLDIAERHAETLPLERQPAFKVAVDTLTLNLARRQGQLEQVVERVNYLASTGVARCSSGSALNGVLHAVALMNLGAVEMWSGRLDDAQLHLREGAELARKIGQPYLEIICLTHLGFSSEFRSFAIARRYSEEAIALAERYGWGSDIVIIPALVTLAGTLIWSGDFGSGERWLQRAANAPNDDGNPPVQLLFHLVNGMLYAGRHQLPKALDEFEAAGRMQAQMVGEHVLAAQATGWMVGTKARLGMLDDACASLANIPRVRADAGEIRNAAAVISLTARKPDAALAHLRDVLEGRARIIHDFTLVEAHLLAARAYHALGEERKTRESVESALALAEQDRLILPFVMTGARDLLEAQPRQTTAHAALLLETLDILSGASPRGGSDLLVPDNELSQTELRVLRYLPTNLSRPEIAQELYVSANTVSTHIRNIYSKLGVSNRTEAVERARQLRLLAQ